VLERGTRKGWSKGRDAAFTSPGGEAFAHFPRNAVILEEI